MEIKSIDYKKDIAERGVIAFVPSGNSMWPTLKNRKQPVIVVKKEQRLKPLDVALYQRKDKTYVLHRVMEVTDNGYIMCGDSQFYLEAVEEDAVFGVMKSFFKGKKYIDVTDEKYTKKIKKWYSNNKRRKRIVDLCFLRHRIKWKIKYIFKKVFRKKDV